MSTTTVTDTLSPAELLKEAVEHPIMSHPFLDRFAAGELDDQGLRRFAVQWYKTARVHKRAFPYVVAVTRNDDIRFGLIHILNEEYGEGNSDRIHARLLERLLQRLGISLGGRSKDRQCKNPYLREDKLIAQLLDVLDQLDLNKTGIQMKFEEELRRHNKFLRSVLGARRPAGSHPEVDLRIYAEYILKEGTNEEKRELIGCFKSRITMTKKVITVTEA